MSDGSESEVRLERVLPDSADAVFSAWTTPEVMARWLSPVGHAEIQADVRPSGRFRVVMVGDGMQIEHTGDYLEVDPPRLLSFTWSSPYTGPEPSVVTVTLVPLGDATRLTQVHRGLPAEHRQAHLDGWGSMIDRLVEALDQHPIHTPTKEAPG